VSTEIITSYEMSFEPVGQRKEKIKISLLINNTGKEDVWF